ncbi:hypothetical protein PHMEG_00038521 [Phytophthora megakarya]|uniref:Uncharacterized protein n=1 Tax=Phytophthora megakarya TaxID=4795 RepID=A0A225UHE5_9STRA|nr:hypothetical protein PHMEG_00038521 [Phytophthora megakarya]
MGHYARECTAPVASGAETWVTTHVSVRHQYTQAKVDVAILGIVTVEQKTQGTTTRVYNGHAVLRTAAPSERESHCEVQGDMPNLVILKVKSMTKRADSLRKNFSSWTWTTSSTWCWACRDLHGMTLLSTGRSVRSYAPDVAAQQRAMALLVQLIYLTVHPNLPQRQWLAPLSPVAARGAREL